MRKTASWAFASFALSKSRRTKPEVYTDASGRATTVAKLDSTGVQRHLSHQ